MVHMNLGSYCLLNNKDDSNKKYIYDPYTVNRKNESLSYNNPYSNINEEEHNNRAKQFGTLFIYQDLDYEN